ncbi:hypothetical protein, partial [Vibrio parahaemolyticus]|uniref:hypothetical protein n=1 Tax=Vibrio parahaemolyticus TaxID=670 RepID=UPI001E4A333D
CVLKTQIRRSFKASETENSHRTRKKKHDFRKLKQLEIEIREPSQKHIDISPKHSALRTFFLVGN